MAEEDAITPATPATNSVASFSRASTCAVETVLASQFSPPFQSNDQLCRDLTYLRNNEKPGSLRSHSTTQRLPDAPRIRLDCPSDIISYSLEDLDTPNLNKIGRRMWWADPTPDIVSLSQHSVLERRIQVTEDPSVHLLWTEGIIFVKPLPKYLASYAYWEFILDPTNTEIATEDREKLKATALGYVRTYACLIQKRSDFNLARRHDLLGSFGNTSFEAFVAFISAFESIPDREISSRWRYGVLNLDALNFHSGLYFRRWHLNRFESRYGAYFSRFFPVVLFIFALLSVILSAMQVITGARQLWDTDNKGLKRTLGIMEWASTEAIGWSLGFGACFFFWFVWMCTAEAVKRRRMQSLVKKRLKKECAGC